MTDSEVPQGNQDGEVWRHGEMNAEVQALLNPLFAQINTCRFCGVAKLRSTFCDCPQSQDKVNDVVATITGAKND